MNEIEDVPIIDWQTCIKLVGSEAYAKEMLATFLKGLPEEVAHIKLLFNKHNYSAMQQCLHKLKGALCYIALPRLRLLVYKLENDLKNNIIVGLTHKLETLGNEIKLLEQNVVVTDCLGSPDKFVSNK